jgi:hypothetical protein
MLRTRAQRFCLITLIFGLVIFSVGLYQWLTPYRHHWVLNTQYIPDYPLDYMGASPSEDAGFIQRHRACEWTSKIAAEYVKPNSEISGIVVIQDEFLTVDGECAKNQISHLEPNALYYAITSIEGGSANPYWNAKLSTGFWDYENLALFRGIGEIAYFSGEKSKSGLEYYKKALKDELQKTGYGISAAYSVAERCIKAEQRWCVEKNRMTYLHVWRVVTSDLTMSIGALLMLLGISGALLYKPLGWLWLHTGDVVIRWVKRGE